MSKGRAMEWAGFGAMMIGGGMVVAKEIGVTAGGSGVGLALAAVGGLVMVAGRYVDANS